MFKKIIIAALVVTSAAFAQLNFNVGGRAAINFGNTWGETEGENSWGLGFNIGAIGKIDINPMLSFVPGLEVEYRRISNEFEYMNYKQKTTFSTTYLDFPLLLRVNVIPKFFVDAGLSVAFNLSASASVEFEDQTEDEDIASSMESIELGAIVGVGYAVMPKLDVNVRFALGFTKMFKDVEGYKNLRFQAGATYWFL